ncbi:RNAse M5 [Hypnocyclicus thermotrophus]|uniref:Ribonuclease M5 n=1 Tax=Hypnocyclicus thermotrophus TaxID=1627895 RepID=A0AA46DZW2_9FUSO|nr:ribonuclease M5 [Hypnocyclicus thermotrophus]TDT71781.1 RNAse M5 [Hypnocyclicus thermotrophus]
MSKLNIEDIIVVEGKDDISAVKRAVNAEVIAVHGYSVHKNNSLDKIKKASEKKEIIILTDPDFAGEKIRKIIESQIPNVKHAYITRKEGRKNNNIGVENASPEAIITALKNAKFKINTNENVFTINDIIDNGLSGKIDSKERRDKLGKILRIGYCNAKQFLNRLNSFGITRLEFEKAIDKLKS